MLATSRKFLRSIDSGDTEVEEEEYPKRATMDFHETMLVWLTFPFPAF
jgi:hypothetical protein